MRLIVSGLLTSKLVSPNVMTFSNRGTDPYIKFDPRQSEKREIQIARQSNRYVLFAVMKYCGLTLLDQIDVMKVLIVYQLARVIMESGILNIDGTFVKFKISVFNYQRKQFDAYYREHYISQQIRDNSYRETPQLSKQNPYASYNEDEERETPASAVTAAKKGIAFSVDFTRPASADKKFVINSKEQLRSFSKPSYLTSKTFNDSVRSCIGSASV